MNLNRRRICLRIATCLLGLFLGLQGVAQEPEGPSGSVKLFDFEEDAQLAALQVRENTTFETTAQAIRGKRALKIVYAAVPEGVQAYPALVVETAALKTRDFSAFESLSLWALNPGAEDVEVGLSIWDKAGRRALPIPSTFTLKPSRWQQVVARLSLNGLDARQIGSIHFYQKSNRKPVTLLIDDVQLLSPQAGRILTRIQSARASLRAARANAESIGAKDAIEPQIAALARRLDRLEAPSTTHASEPQQTERQTEATRIATAAQELANAIRIRNNGKDVALAGGRARADWLSNPDKVKLISILRLHQTAAGNDVFPYLSAAENLEILLLNSKTFTGAGLEKVHAGKLRSLQMSHSGARDDDLQGVRGFPHIQDILLPGTNVTADVLKHFAGLQRLSALDLSGTSVSDVGFEAIEKLTNLDYLDLDRTKITGEALRHLAALPRLAIVNLRYTKVDDAGLASLASLKGLVSLVLENTPITGASFGKLSALKNLVTLKLGGTRVGDSALRELGKLPRLKEVGLSSTRITDGGLQHILQTAQVEYLDLFGTNITDAGLAHLSNQRNLRELYLGGTQSSDAGIAALAKLRKLENLDLEGTQVTDAGLAHLRELPNLATLKLGKTRITGAGLAHLAGLSKLRTLDLTGTGVTDEHLASLAQLENLETLHLSGTRISDKGLAQLRGAKRLTELHLEATDIGNDGLAFLKALPNLQGLNLSETAITDEGLPHLKSIYKLFVLSLNRTRITDEGLASLGDDYAVLEVAHTRITDRGVQYLARNPYLSHLRLSSTGVTSDGLKLLQATPSLQHLDLAETPIDDGGLQHLTLLPKLEQLNLNGTSVSDRGIDSLAKLAGLKELSLENSRITAQGSSYLKHRFPELKLNLVFPWVWGERWSYGDLSHAQPASSPIESSALLQQLKGLASLGYLRLDSSRLTPEVLRSLKDLPTLEHLSFQGAPITDDMLADLLGLSQVVFLDLSYTPISDRGCIHLKDMQGLRELNLEGTRMTGPGLEHLTNLTRLQALNLRGTRLIDESLGHLGNLKELRKLTLSDTHITDADLGPLLNLPRLQYLDLYGARLTDAALARLAKMQSLRYLYLGDTQVTDAGIEHLRSLAGLEELALDGAKVTDRGIALLHSLPDLHRLRIGRTQVTEAGMPSIAGMSNLTQLELDDLPLDDIAVARLATLARLRGLSLRGTRVTDDVFATLAKFPALAEVDVRDTTVTDAAVVQFQQAHRGVHILTGVTHSGYSPWSLALTLIYGVAVFAICFYGTHRYWLSWQLLRDPRARLSPEPKGRFAELPRMTVQLPMFNERHVGNRIIEAACELDYPRDRLQIQVLDDSTDESAHVARHCCERLARLGHPVEYVHRSERTGFKGGALAAGLKSATGEYIAVFDADFVPAPDFLRATLDYFTDSRVGMVQAEWSHLNRDESMLTEIQALFLDGHFVVEQTMRSRAGRWFNFNGTAGVWRKQCIEEAGGWQHDTLTEDTDLSYRAQLAGWRFLYLPTVHCHGELPATMTAFLGQQHRWTKGLIQTAKKLMPKILLSKAPWTVKLEAWFHLTSPVMYLVMFVVTAIALPALFLATPLTDHTQLALAVGLSTLFLGTMAAATFYAVSQRVQSLPLARTLLRIPVLMALGIGMCAVNARAVLESLLGFHSPFVRTPKYGGRSDCDPDPALTRWRWRLPKGLFELLIAANLFACLALSLLRPFTLIGAPFLLLFALGYSGVGVLCLLDRFGARQGQSQPAPASRLRLSFRRLAVGFAAIAFVACVSATALAISHSASKGTANRLTGAAVVGVDLTTANWKIVASRGFGTEGSGGVKSVRIDRGSLLLQVQLDEQADEGEIVLNLEGALQPLGAAGAGARQLSFTVEYPSRFTGEFQAFVKDEQSRSQYGSMEFIESHNARKAATVSLLPRKRMPAMGYQDPGFDPSRGLRQIGLKISAQSDRVRGPSYRPFRGTLRISKVRLTQPASDPATEPEIRAAIVDAARPAAVASLAEFLQASGVDRPWPLGYAFSGPVTIAHRTELNRTYAAMARAGCRLTRVYLGDYRTGLRFDGKGKIDGVEPEFLEFVDVLAESANRHGITVLLSLTDNTLADGRGVESVEYLQEGESSDRFVNRALVEFVKKLKGRQIIWDIFNEPENVTVLSLREVQRYVDRVLEAGRKADKEARFTVVSRSRSDLVYWQGRGLDLYCHNIFTPRGLEEAMSEPNRLGGRLIVAEMAPELATPSALNALRQAGYSGVGLWGWGTKDKYEWQEKDLGRIVRPLQQIAEMNP